MVEAPQTEEGWFALHDFRSIDWDAWRDAPSESGNGRSRRARPS